MQTIDFLKALENATKSAAAAKSPPPKIVLTSGDEIIPIRDSTGRIVSAYVAIATTHGNTKRITNTKTL